MTWPWKIAEQDLKPVQVHLIVKEVIKLLRASLPITIEIQQNIISNSATLVDPIHINNNGQFIVGWVEERNPTKGSRISTQPTIEEKHSLIDLSLFLYTEPKNFELLIGLIEALHLPPLILTEVTKY
jgi:hypothetical protein